MKRGLKVIATIVLALVYAKIDSMKRGLKVSTLLNPSVQISQYLDEKRIERYTDRKDSNGITYW